MKNRSFYSIYFILSIFIIFFSPQSLSGQDANDQTKDAKKNLKNTLRVNLTNPMIFGDQCIIFGYERTIGKHQSFSVGLGRFAMPRLFSFDTDSIKQISQDTHFKGFHISGDYRFYLGKENKFDSPHGVYIAPYATYNSYTRDFEMASTSSSYTGKLNADISLRIATVGFQMGYQFIFWNRVSLDMILFGPGLSSYKFKANLDTNLNPDQESELFQKINEALQEKIPGYSFAVNPGSFEKTGSYNTTGMGFRYVVMLGIRF